MSRVIVVGAGMFGIMAATLAQNKGHDVTILDNRSPEQATPASGFLTRPSWLSSLSKAEIDLSFETLKELYSIETLAFKVTPTNQHIDITRVLYTIPSKIKKLISLEEVREVGNGVVQTRDNQYRGKVLVAAGVYSARLVAMPPISWLMGVSLRFKGQIKEPVMNVWAPYKQALAFNFNSEEIWFGDGTAILKKNWDSLERIEAATKRAAKLFKLKVLPKVCVGARPIVEGHKSGYFAQPFKNTWVSTGGAKNGTVIAALQAKKFVEEAL